MSESESPFVSYYDDTNAIENVHARGCSRAKRDADEKNSPLYPCADNLWEVVVAVFADIWSDTHPSVPAALVAGELENYAEYVHVNACALQAGFWNELSLPVRDDTTVIGRVVIRKGEIHPWVTHSIHDRSPQLHDNKDEAVEWLRARHRIMTED